MRGTETEACIGVLLLLRNSESRCASSGARNPIMAKLVTANKRRADVGSRRKALVIRGGKGVEVVADRVLAL